MTKQYVIIGTAAAGIGAALALRRADATASIICLSDEPDVPYNKCLLSDYAHGLKSCEEIQILDEQHASTKQIELKRGVRVIAIDRVSRMVTCADGQAISYDKLFLGVGAAPFRPPIAGLETHPCVSHFYSLADVDTIHDLITHQKIHTAVVIGAGLSGLECADALNARGVQVTVLERSEQVLGRQIDRAGACRIEQAMKKSGVTVITSAQITRVEGKTIILHDSVLSADVIICATGVRPRVELAHQAALTIKQGAIWIDEHMRTSDEHIYAGGDCALIYDQLSQEYRPNCSWPEAMQQGMIAAQNMVGLDKKYSGAVVVTSSAFFGLKFATCGLVEVLPCDGYELYQKETPEQYLKIVLEDDQVKGFVMVGDTRALSLVRRLIMIRGSFGAHTAQLDAL